MTVTVPEWFLWWAGLMLFIHAFGNNQLVLAYFKGLGVIE